MREGGGRDEGGGVEGDREGDREERRQGGMAGGEWGEREAVLGVRGERGC